MKSSVQNKLWIHCRSPPRMVLPLHLRSPSELRSPGVNEELLAKWQQNPTARAQENLTRQSQDSVIRNYDSTDTRNCRQYVCKACMLLSSMRIFLEKDRNLISQRHCFWLLKIERRAILFYMHFHMTMLVGNVANRSGLGIFKSYVLQMYVVEHKQALKLFQRTFQQYCVTSSTSLVLIYILCSPVPRLQGGWSEGCYSLRASIYPPPNGATIFSTKSVPNFSET